MILRLAIAITLLTLSTGTAVPPSTPPSPAHCECRCCTRTHFHTQCSEPPLTVPLSEGFACDTPQPAYHNPSVCGPALCRLHFGDNCLPPSFVHHACVSDLGALHDWAPLAFVSLALVFAAYAASMFAARLPRVRNTGYKRPDAMEDSQPLVSASSLAASYGVEVLDHSPRRVTTMPVSPPSTVLADPAHVASFPVHPPLTPQLKHVVIEPKHLPFQPGVLPPSERSDHPIVPGDSEDEEEP